MESINKNISELKEILTKRQTYIRFSPIGTTIVWLMYIWFYLFWWNLNDVYYTLLFFSIWIIWVIIVTLLSLLNSKDKWEELLPKSIKYIVVNMFFIAIAVSPLLYLFNITDGNLIETFPIICVAYWLLIIISRFCIQKFLTYFGYILFVFGMLSIWILIFWNISDPIYNLVTLYQNYYKEFILVLFWLSHVFMWYLLHKNNK